MAQIPVRSSNSLVISLAPTSGSGGNNTYIYYGLDWDKISVNHDGYDLGGNSNDQRTQVALHPNLINPDINLSDAADVIGPLLVVVDSDDILNAGRSGENIFVAQGNDIVSGNGGSDLIVGGDGNDTLEGGDSDDRLYGDYTNVPEYLYDFDERREAFWKFRLPSEEDLSVTGDDLLLGGDGADQLFGGPGNDQLDGGPRGDGNADLLVGGSGADIFYLNYDDGDDPNASSFWFGYVNTVTDAFAEDSLKDLFNTVTRDVASSIFADPGAGFILSGTVDVLTTTVQIGIDTLFGLTEAPKRPKNPDDVMVVADFDPREDVLALPYETGKALTYTATQGLTSPVGGFEGVIGIEFNTDDGLFAQVFLDDGFLAEFGLTNTDLAVIDFIDNILQTSLIIESNENPDDPDQGGVQNGLYPFPTDDASYVDGEAPDGIEEKVAIAAPPGTTTELFGAFAPVSLRTPANLTSTPFVAGTDMGDLLNVNPSSFAPEDANTSAISDAGSYVRGFGGADIIFGNNGQDLIYGGDGNDDIYGIGQGDVEFQEQFYGEDGSDKIFLGWSSTWALADGGAGTDWVDFLYLDHKLTLDLTKAENSGSSFNPSNFVTSRYDVINVENAAGTRLDDTIIGTSGNNILQGNDGSDIIESGAGQDTLSFADNSGKVDVDLSQTSADGTLTTDEYGADGGADANTVVSNDTVTGGITSLIGSDFNDSLTGDIRNNFVDGGAGNDLIRGGDGNDILVGKSGNDDIRGQSGVDQIDGGAGDDTIQGDNDDDTLLGGSGNDIVQGDHGNDRLEGGDGDDQLQGGNDHDNLRGDAGNDSIFGGSGDDSIFWTSQDGNDNIDGGSDSDTLTIQTTIPFAKAFPVSIPIRLSTSGNTLTITLPILPTLDVGEEVLTVNNVETIVFEPDPNQLTDALVGTMPDVVIDGILDLVTSLIWTGDEADNLFDGGNATGQTLVLNGAGGDDTLSGGESADTIDGGDGEDTLSGGAKDDTISGGDGNDVIYGNTGADILNGGEGVDQIEGGSGADVITGGRGQDIINGGNGTDSFIWAVGDGADFITGDVDDDNLTLDADDDVDGTGTDIIVSLAPEVDRFDPSQIVTAVQFEVFASSTIEVFHMIEVEDFMIEADPDGTMTSVSGDLSVAGVSENTVTFNGAGGADTFDGSGMLGGVRVVLNGGGGDDMLIGGDADDEIDGGTGRDTVVYDGLRDDFGTLLLNDGRIVLTHLHGEIDRLANIERLEFSDGNLVYDFDSPNLGFVYRLYSAAFDRTPDEAGLTFWLGEADLLDQQGVSETDKQLHIAEIFQESAEFQQLVGDDATNYEYVDAVYRNTLDRPPDQEGHDFWTMRLDEGTTRAEILVLFSESIENRLATHNQFDEGVWVV